MSINPLDQIKSAAGIGRSDNAAPNRPETLKALAAQFESLLIAQMLRDMRSESTSTDGSFGEPLADTVFGEFSNALVNAGGLGLATSLEDAMARTTPGGNPAEGVSVPIPRAYSPWLPEGSGAFAIDAERVSSAYGVRRDPINGEQRVHKGIDIPLATGMDVRSVKGGTVIESDVRGGYGNTVVVDHGDGVTTRYAHLSARGVAVGQTVAAGQTLGLAGQTGRATGPHLHLEVHKDGVAIDPLGADATNWMGGRITQIEENSNSADDVHGASR